MTENCTLNGETKAVWSVSVAPQKGGILPLRNCPVTDGNGHLVAALQDVVVCLAECEDGLRVVWEYVVGSVVPGSPAAAPDGSLRVHAEDGHLHGITADGEPLWAPVEIGEPLSWATPLVDNNGMTWISGYAGGLIKVEADGTTSRRPFLRSPSKFDCTGLMHGGMLIVGSEDHFVHAIDTGDTRGKCVWDQSADRGRTGWFVNSAVAMADDSSFVVAGRDEHLYGLSIDGTQQWKSKAPGQMLGSPVIDAEGRVFATVTLAGPDQSGQGALACFDIRRRQWLWLASAHGPAESTPVVGDDGVVYFGDNAGWVHAVDAKGKLLWQLQTGAAVRSSGTIMSAGHVVFADDAGRLFALKCTSNAVSPGWSVFRGNIGWTALSGVERLATLKCEDSRADVQIPFDCEIKTRTTPAHTPGVPLPVPVQTTLPLHQPIDVAPVIKSDVKEKHSAVAERTDPDYATAVTTASQRPREEHIQVVSETRVTEVAINAGSAEPEAMPAEAMPAEAMSNAGDTVATSVSFPRDSHPPGLLSAIVDFSTGKELLALHHHPWQLTRSGQLDQKALFLSNSGSGELTVTVRSIGTGITLSPVAPLRIPPGGRCFVVVNIEPFAAEWALLEFETPHSRIGRRMTLRLRRSQ